DSTCRLSLSVVTWNWKQVSYRPDVRPSSLVALPPIHGLVACEPMGVRCRQGPRCALHLELLGGEVGPMRIRQMASSHHDNIKLLLLDDALGDFRCAESPCRGHRYIGFATNPFSDRSQKSRPPRYGRFGYRKADADIDHVHTCRFEIAYEAY